MAPQQVEQHRQYRDRIARRLRPRRPTESVRRTRAAARSADSAMLMPRMPVAGQPPQVRRHHRSAHRPAGTPSPTGAHARRVASNFADVPRPLAVPPAGSPPPPRTRPRGGRSSPARATTGLPSSSVQDSQNGCDGDPDHRPDRSPTPPGDRAPATTRTHMGRPWPTTSGRSDAAAPDTTRTPSPAATSSNRTPQCIGQRQTNLLTHRSQIPDLKTQTSPPPRRRRFALITPTPQILHPPTAPPTPQRLAT